MPALTLHLSIPLQEGTFILLPPQPHVKAVQPGGQLGKKAGSISLGLWKTL